MRDRKYALNGGFGDSICCDGFGKITVVPPVMTVSYSEKSGEPMILSF